MGERFRMLINSVVAVKAPNTIPNMPVARILWKPLPDFPVRMYGMDTGRWCTSYLFQSKPEYRMMEDFATMAGKSLY